MEEVATDILIVGGGPGGMMAGLTASQFWPKKRILMVRPESQSVIPCGIPYIFGTLGGTKEDLLGLEPFLASGGSLRVGRVASVDRSARTARLEDGATIRWERLVLGTGGENVVPPIPGGDLEGVFILRKDYAFLEGLFHAMAGIRRLAIIGGGFVGVEFADEIRKRGVEVHLVEMLPHLMQASLDLDLCVEVENQLRKNGVHLHTGAAVEAMVPDASGKRVGGLRIAGQELLPVDAVLISIGVRPNVSLAREMGLTLSRSGGVWVDAFQRSREDPAIFAVGDCAHKQDFFTRKAIHAMFASQAAAEGRIAGMNLYALRQPRYNAGSVSIYASQIDGLAFGVVGMTESQARAEGFPFIVGEARLPDHHPSTLPGTTETICRVILAEDSTQILGGQIMGGPTTGELLNTIGLAVQMHATALDLASMQFGSQPRLTSSIHPLVAATGEALRRHRAQHPPCETEHTGVQKP